MTAYQVPLWLGWIAIAVEVLIGIALIAVLVAVWKRGYLTKLVSDAMSRGMAPEEERQRQEKRVRGAVMRVLTVVAGLSGIGAGTLVFLRMEYAVGFMGPHTPAPPNVNPLLAESRDTLLTFAQTRLQFAWDPADPDRYHGQYDKNLVDTFGTMVTVAPELNIHRSAPDHVRTGRIQLKVELERAPNDTRTPEQIFDSLGVPPGVSYVWIDSYDVGAGTARAVIIPADRTLPARTRTIRLIYAPGMWNQALARWTPGQCWSCMKDYWCESGDNGDE